MLCCAACYGELIDSTPSFLVCSHCGKQYPSINGIDVFLVPNAMSSLSNYVREIDDTKAEFTEINERLTNSKVVGPNVFNERIVRNLDGLKENLKVLEAVYQPIINFVSAQPSQQADLTSHALKSSYTGDNMLPYFYQDWSGIEDYEAVKEDICQVIRAHCHKRDSVAVLGAGACGLLYKVSDYFRISYGVDLSLPGLLMAKKYIEGSSLNFLLKEANWQKVNLSPPKLAKNQIRFLTADVMALPFKDASLSVVISQYLLDIVSNAELFTKEIHRVLEPGGVWINFSKPFNVNCPAELGRYQLSELPNYFDKQGFIMEQMSCQKFTPLNLVNLAAETDSVNDAVHFFTLRKCELPIKKHNNQSIIRFFTKNDAVWNEIPCIPKGREVTFFQKASLNGLEDANKVWLNIMAKLFVVSADLGFLLKSLFELMDGERTLKELFLIVQEQELALTEEQFLVLIYFLNRQYALVELLERPCAVTANT